MVRTARRTTRIVDVAQSAGVSAMTVSRVLNNMAGVSGPTRERVLAAVAELDYRPNRTARSLRLGRPDRIVVRTHTGAGQPHDDLLLALDHQARTAGVELDFVLAIDSRASQADPVPAPVPPTGVLIDLDLDRGVGTSRADRGTVRVTADRPPAAASGWSTRDDLAAAVAVDHLVSLGHTAVAHIAGPVGSAVARGRQRGWLDALTGTGTRPGHVTRGDWTPESGELGAATLLAHREQPTAIFVASDLMAVGALKHLYRIGARVPQDVAVVGFGDMPGARSLIPGLTTVVQRFDHLAHSVVRAALGGTPDADAGALDLPRLLVRESSAVDQPVSA